MPNKPKPPVSPTPAMGQTVGEIYSGPTFDSEGRECYHYALYWWKRHPGQSFPFVIKSGEWRIQAQHFNGPLRPGISYTDKR